ncbi:MAG TPA: tetratricopeptide repeat protein [Thermoguttaceae bacterium]|nr:tetratricopeptide repeat protein [Thermoguttaceae bacterium]
MDGPMPFLLLLCVVALAVRFGWKALRHRQHIRRHERECTNGARAFDRGDYDVALTEFRALLNCPQCDPCEPAQTMVGLCLQMQAKYDEAISAFEIAHKLDPQSLSPIRQLAYLLACAPDDELRDGRRAMAMAKKACGISDDTDWVGLTLLAGAEAELGRFDEAVTVYERAMSLMPEHERDKRSDSLKDLRSGLPFRCNPSFDRSRLLKTYRTQSGS